jgi:hypothetical protein
MNHEIFIRYFGHAYDLVDVCTNLVIANTIDAKVIQNNNRIEKVHTSRGGMEGWVIVSFIIGLDGKPRDIVPIDYSGKVRYINSTIRYVNNLIYSPVMVDGLVTTSQDSLFVPNTYSGIGNSENSVTPAFSREYQGAMDILANSTPDLPNVRKRIDELENDHTKNLNEHAMAAWLESVYYYEEQDFLEYMRQTYINGINISDEVNAQFMVELESKINSEELIRVFGKLTPLGWWIYQNNLKNFKLTSVNGKIDSVQIVEMYKLPPNTSQQFARAYQYSF